MSKISFNRKVHINKNSKIIGSKTAKKINTIGPLQLAIHVVHNRHAGEQVNEPRMDWGKTGKGIIILNNVSAVFLLSQQCITCSPVWRICAT